MEGNSPENDLYANNSDPAASPDLFLSDDDDEQCRSDECPQPFVFDSPLKTEKASGSNLVLELESARQQRLMTLLQGVPPPPSVTIPQMSLTDVLLKLKANADKMVQPGNNGSESVNSLWKPSATLKEVLKTGWPEIKNIVYHDMHYNSCTASEDVEHISMKLHERFIGAETSSWCNAVSSSLTNSSKKRQRRSLGNASPGCRLSHLARRRQTFSSANLAQLSSVAGSGTAGGVPPSGNSSARRRLINGVSTGQRCIMVEIKKTDKNKRIKTNSKEASSKLPLASGSAPKTAAQVQAPVQATKRALFQSPEEQRRAASASMPALSDTSMAQRSKRVLWPSEKETLNDNGKRVLDKVDSSTSQTSKRHCSDDNAPYNRTTRSLPFPLGQNSGTSSNSSNNSHPTTATGSQASNKTSRRASDQGPSQACNLNTELSELHKRKLLWAILSALRTHNINRNHPDFTRLTSVLAYHYVDVRANMAGPPPASTSEHMLQVVSVKATEILKAERSENSGQEENLGGSKIQKKEGSGKELFRDATASLNVRRSLCVSLPSSNHQTSDAKPKQAKRVPSARKSLFFESVDSRTSSGMTNDETEKSESKYQLDSKVNDSKWRGNGENVPIESAKRVSRSLFLSPKDDVKAAKKDACEQTCALEDQASSNKSCDETIDPTDSKSESGKKSTRLETNDADERILIGSEVSSSIPSNSAASSCTLEADNEASRTSDATNLSEQANSYINLTLLSSNLPRKENGMAGRPKPNDISENLKADCGSSESCEFIPSRVLRETRERSARQVSVPSLRRTTRKSLSLSRRDLRSNSSDSTEQEQAVYSHIAENITLPSKAVEHSTICASYSSINLEPMVVLSPLKVPSPSVSAESNATSKSTFGSPPFIAESTLTPAHSPFLGFPSKDDANASGGQSPFLGFPLKDDPNTSGEAADESDSIVKVPDGSSDEGNLSESERGKANLEEKVITPLLEAAVLESSVCVGSGSSHSTDADLTFRGRIECLKPSDTSEMAINLDLAMNLNVSANILNMDENKEKSPVLEKWAERASRSAQKSCVLSEDTIETAVDGDSVPVAEKSSDDPAEESMLPWDESQMEAVSQCSTNMFEKFCSIFDPSSHQGNS